MLTINAAVMTVPLRYLFAISVAPNEIFNELIVSFLQILISVNLRTNLVLLLLDVLIGEVASSPPVALRVLRRKRSQIRSRPHPNTFKLCTAKRRRS